MSEIIKNRYLDLEGLKRYDALIKSLISSGNKDLADAIDALDAKIGSLDIEGSDSKTLTEAIGDIYASIEEIVEKQGSLDDKDVEIEGKINDIIGDLDSLEGSDGVMTLVDISNNLKEFGASVAKNTEDIEKLNGEGEGSVKKIAADAADAALDSAKEYADGLVKDADGNVKFDAAGAAAAAQAAAEATAAADATSKADAALASAKTYADGLVKDAEGKSLFDAAGAAAAAQAAAEATAAADAAAKATAAETAAKGYADSLDTAMDERVKVLEAIDHEQLAADAVAAVVAGAESDFDTLKEVADWIASDKEGSAALQTTVSGHTESINTINSDIDALEKKVDGDIANLTEHMSEAANALAEVGGRLDALEAFEETHASIEDADIDSLFA